MCWECVFKLLLFIIIAAIFYSGMLFSSLISKDPISCGKQGEDGTDERDLPVPTCSKGKLWNPEDAIVFAPLLALPTYEIHMTEKRLMSTYARSNTIALDCPPENRTSTKNHPTVLLVQNMAWLMKYGRLSLPRFWLRPLSVELQNNSSATCADLVRYALEHTPTLFEGVLLDADKLIEATDSANTNVRSWGNTWRTVTTKIINFWDSLNVQVGLVFSSGSCLPVIYRDPSEFRDGLYKTFYFDYDREVLFKEKAAYIKVSKGFKSCRNSIGGQLPMHLVLTDEYDALNGLSHSKTKILCLTNA